jgi:hypothetical protein
MANLFRKSKDIMTLYLVWTILGKLMTCIVFEILLCFPFPLSPVYSSYLFVAILFLSSKFWSIVYRCKTAAISPEDHLPIKKLKDTKKNWVKFSISFNLQLKKGEFEQLQEQLHIQPPVLVLFFLFTNTVLEEITFFHYGRCFYLTNYELSVGFGLLHFERLAPQELFRCVTQTTLCWLKLRYCCLIASISLHFLVNALSLAIYLFNCEKQQNKQKKKTRSTHAIRHKALFSSG